MRRRRRGETGTTLELLDVWRWNEGTVDEKGECWMWRWNEKEGRGGLVLMYMGMNRPAAWLLILQSLLHSSLATKTVRSRAPKLQTWRSEPFQPQQLQLAAWLLRVVGGALGDHPVRSNVRVVPTCKSNRCCTHICFISTTMSSLASSTALEGGPSPSQPSLSSEPRPISGRAAAPRPACSHQRSTVRVGNGRQAKVLLEP